MSLSDPDDSGIEFILGWLRTNSDRNGTVDFGKPEIKPSLKYVYPLFIFVNACAAILGSMGNIVMLGVIIKRRLCKNPTFFFMGNLALSDLIKIVIILPLTLTNMLMKNYMLGSFICFALPMMQSFPNHASILTHVMIAVDRYRYIVHPMKSRVPAGLCTIAVWVISVCIVLPYAVYIKFIDLGAQLGQDFDGQYLCLYNQGRHSEEYIRAMFVTMYCLPLAVIAFLYIRVSVELKAEESPETSIHIEENMQSCSDASYQTRITWTCNNGEQRIEPEGSSERSSHARGYEDRFYNTEYDGDYDRRTEKRTQKYMITMVILFAVLWCPINILSLVTHFVYENHENSSHFDITYLTFTFFGFLASSLNPVLFASWFMSASTRDRLRGYFRFSNRRRSSAHSAVSRGTEIYTPAPHDSPKPHTSTHGYEKSYV